MNNNYGKNPTQPLYCCNCGIFFMDDPFKKVIVCSDKCREIIEKKKACMIVGIVFGENNSDKNKI